MQLSEFSQPGHTHVTLRPSSRNRIVLASQRFSQPPNFMLLPQSCSLPDAAVPPCKGNLTLTAQMSCAHFVLYINGNIQHILFFICVLSRTKVFVRFVHIVTWNYNSQSFIIFHCVNIPTFIYSWYPYGHQDNFQFYSLISGLLWIFQYMSVLLI